MTLTEYTPKEMKAVEELRHRLKGEMEASLYGDTDMFVRFLKARSYDINEAENMLRNHLNFRKTHKLDTIISWYTPNEVAAKYMPFSKLGFDKEGYPVTYMDLGRFDIPGALKSLKETEYCNHLLYVFESDVQRLKEQSKKLKRRIDKWVYVINLEDIPLSLVTSKPVLETIAQIISWYEGNFPERLKTAILINASWYFQIAFAFLKPFISGPTIQKVRIFGKDQWREELTNIIHADDLPAFLGGNMTDLDGDPMCRSLIIHGSKIPEKYYLLNNRTTLSTQPGVQKLVITRLSKILVELQVPDAGSDLEWEFETKGRDIAFCLYYKEKANDDQDAKQLLPKQRVDASLSSQIGLYKCESAGTYYLEFDNSYSWIHQKEVYYKTRVIPPQDQKTFL